MDNELREYPDDFYPSDGEYRAQHRWFKPDPDSDDCSFDNLEDAIGVALSEYDSTTNACLIFESDGLEHLRDEWPAPTALIYEGKLYRVFLDEPEGGE